MTDNSAFELLDTAKSLLTEYPLCDYCLGRQFAWLSTETTNQERGRSILSVLLMDADERLKRGEKEIGSQIVKILAENGIYPPAQELAKRSGISVDATKTCHLCTIEGRSIFDRLQEIVTVMQTESESIEFHSLLVGNSPSPTLVDREDEVRGRYGLHHGETLKSHFNRELGKKLSRVISKPVDFEKPDVVFIYDMEKNEVTVQINPVFVYGRYRKLVRGIPQSRWDCTECRGKGCDECGGTGRRYPDSISEYIGIPAKELMKGSRFKVHAAGREDVDVLMIGSGRPFVLEVSEPKIRTPNLDEMTININESAQGKIEVEGLEISDREHAQKIKSEASENVKEYVAQIQTKAIVTSDDLKRTEKELSDIVIQQRTPSRVSHRRSDLIREKKVLEVKLKSLDDQLIEGFFKVQGGTYIKELISGDEGKTTPSLTSVLGTECICIQLNVTAIYGHVTTP